MPVEVKPLFRPDVLGQRLKTFSLPERALQNRHLLAKWADLLASPQADTLKEQQLLADFLNDIFTGILGYTRPADSPRRYTISREQHVEVDGKFADAVLGEFATVGQASSLPPTLSRASGDACPTAKSARPVVALEGKGPADPLDRPFKNRRMSAVDQGYRYAINLPCDWIIVTSMRQTRLYYKGADQLTCERLHIADLAASDFHFKKFVFLLAAERVVPATGRCRSLGTVPNWPRKRPTIAGLTSDLSDTEAELNERVFWCFDLTPEQIRSFEREVERYSLRGRRGARSSIKAAQTRRPPKHDPGYSTADGAEMTRCDDIM